MVCAEKDFYPRSLSLIQHFRIRLVECLLRLELHCAVLNSVIPIYWGSKLYPEVETWSQSELVLAAKGGNLIFLGGSSGVKRRGQQGGPAVGGGILCPRGSSLCDYM
jgi:hypothetical protein